MGRMIFRMESLRRVTTYAAGIGGATLLGLCMPKLACGQTSNGYAGIYADPAGTIPCLNVPPNTAGVLYVIATCDGLTEDGITGAEFRIEVSNPTGWLFMYNPPSPAVVLGSPIDIDPDSGDTSGVNLAFDSCHVPVDHHVSLGTISVFNVSGSPTSLSIKQHNTPRSVEYPCALLVHCDGPTFSKNCMESVVAGACSTLTTPSKPAISSSDGAVFAALVNGAGAPIETGRSFADSIPLGSSELWIDGHQVQDGVVECVFDGSSLMVGGIEIALVGPEETLTEAELEAVCGDAPSVAADVGRGVPLQEAAAIFEANCVAFHRLVLAALDADDAVTARALMSQYPAIERFTFDEMQRSARIKYRGLSWDWVIGPETSRAIPNVVTPRALDLTAAARRYLGPIRRGLVEYPPGGAFIFVCGGGIGIFNGPERTRARAQMDHVLAGGDIDSVPEGPLTVGQLRCAVEARGDSR